MVLRRFGIIGDVHQEDRALEAVIELFGTMDLDRVVCTGDVADGRGSFRRCCRLLRSAGVDAVRGNHDRWLLTDTARALTDALPADQLTDDDRRYLESWPTTRDYQTPAGPLLLCHGVGENDMNRLIPDDFGYALTTNTELGQLLGEGRYRLMIGGHSHVRMVRSFGQLTVINGGTLLDDQAPCCAVTDLEGLEVAFFDVVGGSRLEQAEVHQLPR